MTKRIEDSEGNSIEAMVEEEEKGKENGLEEGDDDDDEDYDEFSEDNSIMERLAAKKVDE